ncbi:hypothetical protein KC342_g106 [Hortaea werneckii]|nr:hypothetical protein KC342_g106 [Hortaea werneckii]
MLSLTPSNSLTLFIILLVSESPSPSIFLLTLVQACGKASICALISSSLSSSQGTKTVLIAMQIAVAASFSNISSVARPSAPQLAISVAVGALSLIARSLSGTTVFFLPALAVLPDFVSRSLDDCFSADCDELLAYTRRCGLASLERVCHKIIILRGVVVFAVQVFPSIRHTERICFVLRRHETTHVRLIRVGEQCVLLYTLCDSLGRSGLELDHRPDHHAERRLVEAWFLLSCFHVEYAFYHASLEPLEGWDLIPVLSLMFL